MKNTNTITAAILSVSLSHAYAGSLQPQLEDPEVITPYHERFEGFYILTGVGVAGNSRLRFNSESADNVTKDAFLSFDMKARTKAEIGYRWQSGRNVYGVSVSGVADFGQKAFSCDDVAYSCKGGITSAVILAGTFGRVVGKSESVLVYGKAGAGFTRGSMWHKRVANNQEWNHSFNGVSPVVGAGMQKVFDNGFIAGLEASWMFTGKETWDINVWGPHDHRLETGGSVYTLTLDLGWQF